MDIHITDIYRLCRDAVRFFPATSPVRLCSQLQAFRVLQHDPGHNAEVGTDTLGAIPVDRNSPFFYSKKWELNKFDANRLSYQYPILTAFELTNHADSSVFLGKANRIYLVELAVLDSYQADKGKGGAETCGGRSINQIYLNSESLLDSVLKYIGGAVVATTNVDPVQKIYYVPFLDAAVTAGDIASYSVIADFGKVVAGNNQAPRFDRVEYPAKGVYGTKVQLKIRVQNCPTFEFNTEALDLGVVGFEIGCDNC